MLVVVIKKKKKRQYDFEQESPSIALNPVYGVEEGEKKGKLFDDDDDDDEKKYNLYDMPEKEEFTDKC